MKNYIIYILAILFITSCSRYQVVQEVRVNMYHMYSPKKGVEIIITKDSLELGKWYNLRSIKTIDLE